MHVAVFAVVFASASKGERWRVIGNLSPAGSKVILYSFPAPSGDAAGDSHAPASYVGATWLDAEAGLMVDDVLPPYLAHGDSGPGRSA